MLRIIIRLHPPLLRPQLPHPPRQMLLTHRRPPKLISHDHRRNAHILIRAILHRKQQQISVRARGPIDLTVGTLDALVVGVVLESVVVGNELFGELVVAFFDAGDGHAAAETHFHGFGDGGDVQAADVVGVEAEEKEVFVD